MSCPICAESAGFHSEAVHSKLVVPRHLLKEKDWLKKYLEAMKRSQELADYAMHPM